MPGHPVRGDPHQRAGRRAGHQPLLGRLDVVGRPHTPHRSASLPGHPASGSHTGRLPFGERPASPDRVPTMARKAKELLDELTRRGPHRVLRGDLALVGLPGLVYTPERGLGLPAVAFGHGWLQPPVRYAGLLRHLASWGIVVAAPGTHVGPLGSHRLLAADLRTALDMCTGVRLGEGDLSV